MRHTTTFPQLLLIFICTLFLFSQAAYAITLKEAKAANLIGEKSNGYIGVISNSNPELTTLVQTINQKRKQKYQAIAASNGTSLKALEIVAGQKTIQKTPVGQYIQVKGVWVKK